MSSRTNKNYKDASVKDRRRIAMPQCSVQTPICSPRRRVIAGMAVSASQWENCGRGVLWMSRKTVVREKWFVDRSPSGAAPGKAGGEHAAPCRFAGACLYLWYLCLVWVKMDGSRRVVTHTCCRSPRNSSPKIGFDRALPRSRGSENGRQTREIEPAKPKPREGVSAVQGPSRCLCFIIHPQYAHNPPTRIARFGCKWCSRFPNLLSEPGLTNTSSNESHHHHDHDHATMSLFVYI